jgi:hypothetical protein
LILRGQFYWLLYKFRVHFETFGAQQTLLVKMVSYTILAHRNITRVTAHGIFWNIFAKEATKVWQEEVKNIFFLLLLEKRGLMRK